jgi:hypothetical protein
MDVSSFIALVQERQLAEWPNCIVPCGSYTNAPLVGIPNNGVFKCVFQKSRTKDLSVFSALKNLVLAYREAKMTLD